MKAKDIVTIFDNQGIFLDEDEVKTKLGPALYDLMSDIAVDMEEKEPYATNAINALRDARSSVDSYCNDAE